LNNKMLLAVTAGIPGIIGIPDGVII
jgi:hypothetical protein